MAKATKKQIDQMASELQAMEDSIMDNLASIVGKPVTVQFVEEDGTVTGEIKPKELSKDEVFDALASLESKGQMDELVKGDFAAFAAALKTENAMLAAVGDPAPLAVGTPKTVVLPMDEKQAGLVTNSVLVRIGFGVLGNSKKANVEVKTGADQNRFKVHKMLLDSPQLKAINKADMKIRQYLYKEAIPFDMGSSLVSFKKIDNLIAVLDEYRDVTRPALVQELVAAYPAQVQAAQDALKGEFQPEQFPKVADIPSHFTFEYKFMGFDVPGSLNGINASIYKAQVAKAQAQIADVTHEIQQAQRTILFSLVDGLAFKLMPKADGKVQVINPGAVQKLQKFLADFEMNDVTGDAQSAKLISQLKALTEGASPETFKNDAELKAKTATALVSIQDSLEGLLDTKPERKYKDLEDDEDAA
jgi:hypothetical protein